MNKSIKEQLEDIENIIPPEPCDLQKHLLKEDLEWCEMMCGINEDLLGSVKPIDNEIPEKWKESFVSAHDLLEFYDKVNAK